MPGILSQWVLRRVVRSARVFEAEAISAYQRLREKAKTGQSGSDVLDDTLCRLLAEEELHRKVVAEIAAGDLTLSELERSFNSRSYSALKSPRPLDDTTLSEWGDELASALEQEEKTWIFYGNLQRTSKIPAVRKAFELLAAMEKEHLDILRRLLGRS